MNTDTKNHQIEALSIAESIAMRLRDIIGGEWTDRRTSCEYADMARTLRELEARLYCKGEYAPENVART